MVHTLPINIHVYTHIHTFIHTYLHTCMYIQLSFTNSSDVNDRNVETEQILMLKTWILEVLSKLLVCICTGQINMCVKFKVCQKYFKSYQHTCSKRRIWLPNTEHLRFCLKFWVYMHKVFALNFKISVKYGCQMCNIRPITFIFELDLYFIKINMNAQNKDAASGHPNYCAIRHLWKHHLPNYHCWLLFQTKDNKTIQQNLLWTFALSSHFLFTAIFHSKVLYFAFILLSTCLMQ